MTAVTDDRRVSALVRDFSAEHGAAPTGVWAAPGRVNLIGEHTDYNDGLVLPIALSQRIIVAARLRSDRRLTARSKQSPIPLDVALDDLRPGVPDGWGGYVAGAVWALGRLQVSSTPAAPFPGIDLLIDGNVPLGAGLSSSAALECAVLVAAAELWGADAGAADVAHLAQRVENDYVGAPTGLMDQMASMCCTAGHALLFDVADSSTRQVPFAPARHDLALLVVDTRVAHLHAGGAYGQRRRECEQAAAELGVASLRSADRAAVETLADPLLVRRARHVVSEIARVSDAVDALDAGDLTRFGALMTASHVSLHDDFEVSCPELDLVVEVSLAGGALGARMTGGGFGGSAIALVLRQQIDVLATAIGHAFAGRGWRAPATMIVEASAGAGRVA